MAKSLYICHQYKTCKYRVRQNHKSKSKRCCLYILSSLNTYCPKIGTWNCHTIPVTKLQYLMIKKLYDKKQNNRAIRTV
jgi:hypothetical protein